MKFLQRLLVIFFAFFTSFSGISARILGLFVIILLALLLNFKHQFQPTSTNAASQYDHLILHLPVDYDFIEMFETEAKPYIKDTDIFSMNNHKSTITAEGMNELAERIHATYPNNRITALLNPDMLATTAGQLSPLIDTITIDHEPTRYPDWSWDYVWNLQKIQEQSAFIRSNGKMASSVPTIEGLDRTGNEAWDYGEIASGLDFLKTQTQGRCRRDLASLHTALTQLTTQFANQGVPLSKLGTEISIGDTPNSVTTSRALDCTEISLSYGIKDVLLFDPERLIEYLEAIRPLNPNATVTPTPVRPAITTTILDYNTNTPINLSEPVTPGRLLRVKVEASHLSQLKDSRVWVDGNLIRSYTNTAGGNTMLYYAKWETTGTTEGIHTVRTLVTDMNFASNEAHTAVMFGNAPSGIPSPTNTMTPTPTRTPTPTFPIPTLTPNVISKTPTPTAQQTVILSFLDYNTQAVLNPATIPQGKLVRIKVVSTKGIKSGKVFINGTQVRTFSSSLPVDSFFYKWETANYAKGTHTVKATVVGGDNGNYEKTTAVTIQ